VSGVRDGLDFAFALLGAVAWALAAFFLGSRLVSTAAAGVVALGLLVSLLVMLVNGRVQESRLGRLVAGRCPACRGEVRGEHEHRRLGAGGAWLPPLTSWQCGACGFAHSEAWPCAGCPTEP